MSLPPKLSRPLFAALIAAFAASSWAVVYEYNSTLVPRPSVEPARTTTITTTEAVATPLVLAPGETVVAVEERPPAPIAPAPAARPAPATPIAERAEPSIEITRLRLTPDQRIQVEVMERLARNPDVSGQIGVVSEGQVVTLTGWTATSGQASRAGRAARSVDGVRQVVNDIRPRVGGMVS